MPAPPGHAAGTPCRCGRGRPETALCNTGPAPYIPVMRGVLLTAAVALSCAAASSAQQLSVAEAGVPEVATAAAGIRDADGVDLASFMWVARPFVIFADTPADPAFAEQVRNVTERMDALAERDVVVITDTDPANPSAVRRKLRPRGFSIVLIDKDGGIKLRKASPWTVRELSQAIDKTPLRIEEMQQQRPAGR